MLAHKFLSCLDKGISVSVVQMKCIVMTIMRNINFEMVEGHAIEPNKLLVSCYK
jgi:hypothetical protein